MVSVSEWNTSGAGDRMKAVGTWGKENPKGRQGGKDGQREGRLPHLGSWVLWISPGSHPNIE